MAKPNNVFRRTSTPSRPNFSSNWPRDRPSQVASPSVSKIPSDAPRCQQDPLLTSRNQQSVFSQVDRNLFFRAFCSKTPLYPVPPAAAPDPYGNSPASLWPYTRSAVIPVGSRSPLRPPLHPWRFQCGVCRAIRFSSWPEHPESTPRHHVHPVNRPHHRQPLASSGTGIS